MQISLESPAAEPAFPARKDLRNLCRSDGVCISLYIGPHAQGAGTQPFANRVKTLLPQAAGELESRGIPADGREALLRPLERMGEGDGLEGGHADGMAVFRSGSELSVFRLPSSAVERCVVDERFFLRPLLESLRANRRHAVLALARKHVRLIECRGGWRREVALPAGAPHTYEGFGNFDAPDHNLKNRSVAGPGVGSMGGVLFGTGSEQDDFGLKLHDFHRAIDSGLNPLLDQLACPLVLAGAEADLASYMKVNSYQPIVDPPITGSPDGGSTDAELTERSRAIVADWLSPEETKAIDLHRRAGRELVSEDFDELIAAASQGRVRHLFMRTENGAGSSHDDAVNRAIIETIRHDGFVWPLAADHMPDSRVMTALYRY